ncbi:cholesterol oxidase [Paenarthrobacter nicotinovorans]|uniref:GMC oxidoreductase n=1 Tax=Micrococcaceae TaxID=1268 RepID=UPI0008761BA8|nr:MULTISPECIES: GMC oxidoreductase [Micrococcaceae]MDR6437235.1 cholesterol oxidase [Paenarthrobacter nicotinovorans]SCZ54009.1 cholesterol oxidase [Arthrobacter sp. UNCCL28]
MGRLGTGNSGAAGPEPASDQARRRDGIEKVDAVVVGSGFGGSVAALRLAEAGQSVVLMERGKPYPPGSFARSPSEMGRNFWDPDRGLYGLFDAWTFRGTEGLVSSGLGGGSLIYANVLLRKDEKWFVNESPIPGGGYENWPFTRADLDPHYDAAEAMLQPVPYPYMDTAKTLAMEKSAANLGLSITRPPIAVTFSAAPGTEPRTNHALPLPGYGSIHGPATVRTTCTLSGECDIGCNAGAKNTLDHNYISAAAFKGADVRTFHDVRGIRPLNPGSPGGGYEVRYVVHHPDHHGELLTERIIHCRRLMLGAGTFGTNFLLLRNRGSLPALSDALGTRFSGNGDLLTFIMGAKTPPANGSRPGVRNLAGSRGPVITTAIRVPDSHDDDGDGRGYYVEDAGYPAFMNWLIETAQLGTTIKRTAKVAGQLFKDRLFDAGRSNVSADLAAAVGDGRLSSSSVPMLGMGRDVPDGVMTLRDGRLAIAWTMATSKEYFGRVRETMESISKDLDGDFIDNPLWWAKRVITVHPIGGAPSGRHPGEAVCDSYGEVFGYPGLFVVDGAAMPGPVGANPSLTIAAFAERTCAHIIGNAGEPGRRGIRPADAAGSGGSGEKVAVQQEAAGAVVDVAASAPRALAPDATKGKTAPEEKPASAVSEVPEASQVRSRGLGRPGTPGVSGKEATSVRFTEQMHGWFSPGIADPEKGRSLGRDRSRKIMFELTIIAEDIEAFASDPNHPARAEGYVLADYFGGRMPVERGWFNLFVQETADAAAPARRMLYRLWLRDPGGTPFTFTGHKLIRNEAGFDLWADTTTLYATILRGHVPPDAAPLDAVPPDAAPPDPGTQDAPPPDAAQPTAGGAAQAGVVGAGILYIRPLDFAKQLTTFRAEGPAPAAGLVTFGKLFAGELWQVYGRRPRGVPFPFTSKR